MKIKKDSRIQGIEDSSELKHLATWLLDSLTPSPLHFAICIYRNFVKNFGIILLLTSYFLLLTSPTFAFDWQTFKYDLAGTRSTTYEVTAPLTQKWEVTLSGKIYASATTAKGIIYIGTTNGSFYAIDAYTGDILHQVNNLGMIYSSASVDKQTDTVYFCTISDKFYALSAKDLSTKWTYTGVGMCYSSPLIVEDKVIVGCGYPYKKIIALNKYTGELLWQKETQQYVYSSAASDNNIVYIGANDSKLYALNKDTGYDQWHYSSAGSIYMSSPAISKDKVIFISSDFDKNIYAINKDTGLVIWQYLTVSDSGKTITASSPAVDDDKVYIIAGTPRESNLTLYAININTGGLAWSYPLGKTAEYNFLSSPTVAGKIVYVGTPEGKLLLIDKDRGGLIEEKNLTSPILSSPTCAYRLLFVATTTGKLIAYKESSDITPPDVVIHNPAAVNAVHCCQVPIVITAWDVNFLNYILDYSKVGERNFQTLKATTEPVVETQVYYWDTTHLPDGQYILRLRAWDKNGLSNETEIEVELDNTKPQLIITSPVDNLYTNTSPITISGSTQDANDIEKLLLNDISILEYYKIDYTFQLQKELMEGNNLFTIKSIDRAGNETITARTVIYDKTSPQIVKFLINDAAQYTNNKIVNIKLTIKDNQYFDKVEIAQSEDFKVGSLNFDGRWQELSTQFDYELQGEDGKKQVYIRVTDLAGNKITDNKEIIVDTHPPEIVKFVVDDNNEYTTTPIIKVEINVTDNISINKILISQSYQFDTNLIQLDGNWQNLSTTFDYKLIGEDGKKKIYLKIEDFAQNKVTDSKEITVDTILPQITKFQVNENKEWSNKPTVRIELQVSDNLNIDKVLISQSHNFTTNLIRFDGGGQKLSTQFDYELQGEDGKKQVYIRVTDLAGNKITDNKEIIVDTHPPEIVKFVVNDNNKWLNKLTDIKIDLEVTDNISVYKIILSQENDKNQVIFDVDSPQFSTITYYDLIGNEEGKKNIYLKVIDYANNYISTCNTINYLKGYAVIDNSKDNEVFLDGVKVLEVPYDSLPEGITTAEVFIKKKDANDYNNISFNKEELNPTTSIYEFKLNSNGEEIKVNFKKEVTITLSYNDNEVNNEHNLRIFELVGNSWVKVNNHQSVDTINNLVTTKVKHFSIYRIFEILPEKELLSYVINYPNPFNPIIEDTNIMFKVNKSSVNITIEIYSLSGELIKKIYTIADIGTNKIKWDGRNKYGNIVANGVYIYRMIAQVNNEKEIIKGKIVVLK